MKIITTSAGHALASGLAVTSGRDLNLPVRVALALSLSLALGCASHPKALQEPLQSIEGNLWKSETTNESSIHYQVHGGGPKLVFLVGSQSKVDEVVELAGRLSQLSEVFIFSLNQPAFQEVSLSEALNKLKTGIGEKISGEFQIVALDEAAVFAALLANQLSNIQSVNFITPLFAENVDEEPIIYNQTSKSRTSVKALKKYLISITDTKELEAGFEKFKLSPVPKKLFYSTEGHYIDKAVAENLRRTFNHLQIYALDGDENQLLKERVQKISALITRELLKSH